MNTFGIAQAFTSWHSIIVMTVLICMSIYLFALILVRAAFFSKMEVDSEKIMGRAQDAISKKDVKTLAELKGQRPADPPIRVLISVGLSNTHLDQSELIDLLGVTRIRQRERLTKGLSIFGTFATIAPFLGLLGTVIGIVESFNSLAQTGSAGPNVVAAGVATALWATAAGLVVAIPSVVAYNVFKNKAKAIMVDLEVVSRELQLLFKVENIGRLKGA